MSIGARRHRLTLERPSSSSPTGYEPVGVEWGSIRLASTNEALRFGAPTATGQHVIEIPLRDDVRANWRISEAISERSFEIAGYGDPSDDGKLMRLFCSEIQ